MSVLYRNVKEVYVVAKNDKDYFITSANKNNQKEYRAFDLSGDTPEIVAGESLSELIKEIEGTPIEPKKRRGRRPKAEMV